MYIKYFDFKILTSEYWVVCLTIAIVNSIPVDSKTDKMFMTSQYTQSLTSLLAVPPMRKKVMSRVRVTYITLRTKYRNFVYSDRNTMCFFSETFMIVDMLCTYNTPKKKKHV